MKIRRIATVVKGGNTDDLVIEERAIVIVPSVCECGQRADDYCEVCGEPVCHAHSVIIGKTVFCADCGGKNG